MKNNDNRHTLRLGSHSWLFLFLFVTLLGTLALSSTAHADCNWCGLDNTNGCYRCPAEKAVADAEAEVDLCQQEYDLAVSTNQPQNVIDEAEQALEEAENTLNVS